MRGMKTIEVNLCDLCQSGTAYRKCFRCGKDICGDCPAAEFGTDVTSGYSVYYCIPCDIELCETEADALHAALMAVRALKQEEKDFYTAWEPRRGAARAQAQAEYLKRRG
jgi:hypothetical protein